MDWLDKVWNRRHGVIMKKKKSMLVWDMFRGHLTDNVKKAARKINTTLAVIPGGLTSLLQRSVLKNVDRVDGIRVSADDERRKSYEAGH